MLRPIERCDHLQQIDLLARRRRPAEHVQTSRDQPLLDLQQLFVQRKNTRITIYIRFLRHEWWARVSQTAPEESAPAAASLHSTQTPSAYRPRPRARASFSTPR